MSLLGTIIKTVGGVLGSKSQKKGSQNILNDYNSAQGTSLNAFNEARNSTYGFYAPWQQGGQNAFDRNQQMQTPGFQYSPSDPSYAWRVGQGVQAVDRSAASRGMLQSGGTLKALTKYGQDMGSQEFNNDFTRNNLLSQYGLQATQGLADAQRDWASGYGNSLFRGAQGRASAYGAKADANSSLIGNLTGGAQNLASFFTGGGGYSGDGGPNAIGGADGGFIPF